MFTLNEKEQKVYNEIILNVIPNLSPGKYLPCDFFENDKLTDPRVCRKLREQVAAGMIMRISFVGSLSSEGYLIS